jgi:hypothetical protein
MPHVLSLDSPPTGVRPNAVAVRGRRRFWLRAMLLFPALNVTLLLTMGLLTASSSEGESLILAAVILALGQLALLYHDASKRRIGGWGVLAAMVGDVLATIAGLFLAGYATLVVMCQTGNCPIS